MSGVLQVWDGEGDHSGQLMIVGRVVEGSIQVGEKSAGGFEVERLNIYEKDVSYPIDAGMACAVWFSGWTGVSLPKRGDLIRIE